jgi:hypothetical protein
MGLPFKNGFELAQAMGFGKMYQVSKQKEENNIQMESKTVIRMTEKDLHNVIKECVVKLLRENAWGKYPTEDQTEASYDDNMNIRTSGEWADAYKRNDPMIKNIHGSTLRHMMNSNLK